VASGASFPPSAAEHDPREDDEFEEELEAAEEDDKGHTNFLSDTVNCATLME
jgi:hypothetical protein